MRVDGSNRQPSYRRMLKDTSTDAETDLIRLEENFRLTKTVTVGEVDVHAKLANLQQKSDESLFEYSSRAAFLLHELDKDQVV